MIIERYAIGDVLRVKVGDIMPVWEVRVTGFKESDSKTIGFHVEAIPDEQGNRPFTKAVIDNDAQVLGFVSPNKPDYQLDYTARYLELIEALKIIQKHLDVKTE